MDAWTISYQAMQHESSINCDQFIQRASDFIDDQLEPGAVAAMQMHLAGCASCARYHRVLLRGLALVQDVPSIEPSPDFALRLHMRLRAVDDEMLANQRAVTSGVAVVLSVAVMVALAAWGPLLTLRLTGSVDRVAARSETATDAPPLDLSPAPPVSATGTLDWLMGTPGFGGVSLRPANVNATFPGPYSPLVIQPPDVGSTIQTSFSGNE